MWAAGGECKERQPTPGHYHRNGCTAQKTAQKKPRQEAGLVCGSARGPAAGPRGPKASAANPLTQRGRRIIGCTPRGGKTLARKSPAGGRGKVVNMLCWACL